MYFSFWYQMFMGLLTPLIIGQLVRTNSTISFTPMVSHAMTKNKNFHILFLVDIPKKKGTKSVRYILIAVD